MSKIRRVNIVELFKQLVLENEEYTVPQLISSVMRKKNFSGGEPYDASDIEVSAALENTIYELKNEEDGE